MSKTISKAERSAGAQTFYHFTKADKLASISQQGLIPCVPQQNAAHALLTLGKPVVWLTARADDVAWNVDGKCDMRLDVRLNLSKRLVHWTTWLRSSNTRVLINDRAITTNEMLDTLLADLSEAQARSTMHHYVYFGTIPPDRIVAGLPAVAA